jgi:hypothetical protein
VIRLLEEGSTQLAKRIIGNAAGHNPELLLRPRQKRSVEQGGLATAGFSLQNEESGVSEAPPAVVDLPLPPGQDILTTIGSRPPKQRGEG